MSIQPATSSTQWTHYFNDLGSPSFLQSWEWGELQKQNGYEVMRLVIGLPKDQKALACVLGIRSKRGSFLFVPHGPIMPSRGPNNYYECIALLKKYLCDYARSHGYDFIRISPLAVHSQENEAIFRKHGFQTAPIYMHAERVWQLPLADDSEAILSRMRKTTRYSIRRSEKLGVSIETAEDEQSVDRFWDIYSVTAQREGFTPFSKQYLLNEFRAFHKTGNALFLFGYGPSERSTIDGMPERELQAAALIVFTHSTAFYHQGATLHSKAPTSYLLQWHAIQAAIRRNCSYYNFWGIHRPGRTPSDWTGLSLFKQGFGGEQIDYVVTQDYPINRLRYLYCVLAESYLKFRRGIR